MVYKTYIFIDNNLLKLKIELKNLKHSFYSIDLSNGTIFAKKWWFFEEKKKNAAISKIEGFLVLKGIFFETSCVCTYLTNFKVLA